MDVSDPFAKELPQRSQELYDSSRPSHQYPTRHSAILPTSLPQADSINTEAHRPVGQSAAAADSSTPGDPKTVSFRWIFPHDESLVARLPLRMQIRPHNTTESIIATLTNFFGPFDYELKGISFEDEEGNTLDATYDNLKNDSTVNIRVRPDESYISQREPRQASPRWAPRLDEPFQPQLSPPHQKPGSRAVKKRSMSPASLRGFQSSQFSKTRAEHSIGQNSRVSAFYNTSMENELANGHDDSDGGSVSVSSSRRAKSDHLASAEISVDNIVDGGRRKRAFESSELPLFIPPQVPMQTSISSMSPQRRLHNPNAASPSYNMSNGYAFHQPLPSPQSYGYDGRSTPATFSSHGYRVPAAPQAAGHRLRARTSGDYPPTRNSAGVFPTPDPTIGSVISDEDVALQLMRLGDAKNFVFERRPDSVGDDALSGKAELASSGAVTDDDMSDEDGTRPIGISRSNYQTGPARKKQRGSTQVVATFANADTSEEDSDDSSSGQYSRRMSDYGHVRPQMQSMNKRSKSNGSKTPLPSFAQANRKDSAASSASLQNGAGEDDLSSKPRCQRCRKSKKGCDRQRPCQRCKDAGIGIEGCVSEDEGNGRKGRYGRHMGVPLKKEPSDGKSMFEQTIVTAPPSYYAESYSGDKSKKRKR